MVYAAALLQCQASVVDSRFASCWQPGTLLIAEQGDQAVAVEPDSGRLQRLAVDPAFVDWVARARRSGDLLMPSRWQVVRTADERGRRIQVFDGHRNGQVFDELFEPRIELAASEVTPTGRYTVFIQANNVASEVTILDAATVERRMVSIRHGASLAAHAISIVFSPDQRCAAISMERTGGGGAETWLLRLATGDVARMPAADLFVIDWIPDHV